VTAPVGVVMRRAAELAARRSSAQAEPRERRVVREPVRSPVTCVYCGSGANTNRACRQHNDLPKIDAGYPPVSPLRKTEPAEDFRPEVLLDRLQTSKG
jgi:hypothetical protein